MIPTSLTFKYISPAAVTIHVDAHAAFVTGTSGGYR